MQTQKTQGRVLGGSGGMVPWEKKLTFEVFILLEMHWNCQTYYHHVILYHFKYFTTFLAPGGVHAHPAYPPAYGPGSSEYATTTKLWNIQIGFSSDFKVVLAYIFHIFCLCFQKDFSVLISYFTRGLPPSKSIWCQALTSWFPNIP